MSGMRASNGKPRTDARMKLATGAEKDPLVTLQIPESLWTEAHISVPCTEFIARMII